MKDQPDLHFQRESYIPAEHRVLLKTVPASAGDEIIGTADLYNDGSVDIYLDPDVPQDTISRLKALEKELSVHGSTG